LAFTTIYANSAALFHNPRGYYQKIVSPKVNLLKTVTNTGMTHNENYLIEATCSSSPGQVLTTAQPGGETPYALRLFSMHKGKFDMVFIYLQLAEFDNQVEPGDELHFKVTYIGEGKYHNQSTSWSYFVPEGTASIILNKHGEEQTVPPIDIAKEK
jgi:hypothetical protein